MKALKFFVLFAMIVFMSCSSLKVTSDYNTQADFSKYKTYAFFKKGIDDADVSDLDKRRILKAIESELSAKGFVKSDNPDFLVNIFTKSRQKVNVTDSWNFGWGWGWNPWMWGGMNRVNVNQYTEGTLFIDFIDRKSKELFWQGIGSGALRMKTPEKKEKRIKEFVKKILERYPPK